LKHHELIRSIDTTPLTEKKKVKTKPWLMPGYLRQLLRGFVVFCRYSELIGAVLLVLLYHITKALSIVSGSKKPPARLTQVAFLIKTVEPGGLEPLAPLI